jgi:hypothetical protein
MEPEPGATVSTVAANDPDWAFGPDATLSAVGALPARPRDEPTPPELRPEARRSHRVLRTALVIVLGAGVAARWAWVEVEHKRLHRTLAQENLALAAASTTGAERDQRLLELEQKARQATSDLAIVKAKLANAEAAAAQARGEADELRQTVAAKQTELDQAAKDLEEARQRALRAALDDAKAQSPGEQARPARKPAHGGRGSPD